MARTAIHQHFLRHRGRAFHFVAYQGDPATKDQPAGQSTWYLMSAGKRWSVMPEDTEHSEDQRDALLTAWLDENVFEADAN